ncbi:uncharacterized protein STEHIDRAFT_117979 [Stereum hirsutum FP-91666 SS1]|uniref:uncharacterized protein n=1 Tax=Stereum hirsutum (strain FP-91666) TaxID=721885 RepID=UPI000440C0E8|nr:uncharacterized protein STEHIDRAFT_117979 [Stereum hirsutum FP-91666 SS1]EIM90695.1 hypothetical protein STEHIDRAFT_117979 [Stereum hirsutum FP-91666 SS1]
MKHVIGLGILKLVAHRLTYPDYASVNASRTLHMQYAHFRWQSCSNFIVSATESSIVSPHKEIHRFNSVRTSDWRCSSNSKYSEEP